MGWRPEFHQMTCLRCGHDYCEECELVLFNEDGSKEEWAGERKGRSAVEVVGKMMMARERQWKGW
jgi:hypothetical protein